MSLRTRCATASSRGSAALAAWLAPGPAERDAPALDARERDPLLVPLPLLLFVVRRVPLDRLLLDRLALDRLALEPVPLEPRDRPLPDEPPELEPELPLLLAWGMPSSWLGP
ncbi:MAG: hypothetical protein JO262_18940 [Solirubrobacterales bacterium]|nr:hypothetical protein [Solirubrobacterales bacterium]